MKRKWTEFGKQNRRGRIGLCMGLVLLFCMLGFAPALAAVLELPSALTQIADEAFMNDTAITSVVIPDGTTSIGARAFAGCGNLEMITIPETVARIGDDAFKGCEGLSVDTVEGSYAWDWCNEQGIPVYVPIIDPTGYTFALLDDGTYEITGYTGEDHELKLPWCNAEGGKVTRIAERAFYDCADITSVKVPTGITEIGEEAFYFCDRMEELDLPESLLTIEGYAFYSCDRLEEIYIPNSVETLGEYAFGGCNLLNKINYPINWKNTTGYCSPFAASEKLTLIVVPEGVTSIPKNAFYWCDGLSDIQLPKSLIEIGDYAFMECAQLSEIELPDGIEKVGRGVFAGSGLKSISVPASLKSFYKSFSECTSLQHVMLEEGLQAIDSSAFSYCSGLEQIVFPKSLIEIGSDAFYECSGLTGDLIIPERVKEIGRYAFYSCGYDGTITLPNGLETIGYQAFAFCKFDGNLIIPDSATSIDSYAFHDCYSLDSLMLSNGMTGIEDSTFAASGFTGNLYIPDGIAYIADNAFKYCDNLRSVYIPANVRQIGMDAFPSTVTIYGVSGSYAETYAVENGIVFIAGELTTPPEELVYTVYNDHITIDGYSGSDAKLIIPNEINGLPVTSISSQAFSGQSGLISISIPENVTSIGRFAFSMCSSLVEICVDQNNTAYTSDAGVLFTKDMQKLVHYPCNKSGKDYSIPDGVVYIGDDSFEISKLTSITIPESVVAIGEGVFYSCSNLSEINIPNSVKSIGTWAFFCCSSLENIDMPDSITTLGNGAFLGCDKLERISISNGLESIQYNTFGGCSKLKSVRIPESVTFIGRSAFSYCTDMESIYIPDTVTIMEEQVFDECEQVIIYGISGSYAETYAAENGIAFVADMMPTVDLVVDVDGNCVTVSVTAENAPGSYRYQYELVINDKTVSISELTSATQYSFHVNEAGLGMIRLCTKDITDDSFVMYREMEFSVDEEFNCEGQISITPSVTTAEVGEIVTFTVNASDAYKVRLLVDSIIYEEYIMTADETQVERAFTLAGERAVQFQRWDGENWGAISEALTLTITSQGKLAQPVFAPLEDISLYQALNLEWTAVENASAYMVYLSYNDMELWRTDEPVTDTVVQIPGENFAFPGDYVVLVIAIGNGYSQTEYGQVVTVVQKEYELSLDTSLDGGEYVVGDRFECNISNPDGGYVVLMITPPDGIPVQVPVDGAITDTEIYLAYLPKTLGTYTVQAFVFETEREVYHTAFAANQSEIATLTVTGSDIYDNRLGDGKGCQPIAEAYTVSVETNNAVDQVTFHAGDGILTEMEFVEEVDYVRYFTASVSGLNEGFHKYYFSALDTETRSVHEGTFGFYAYTPEDGQTLYPAYHGLEILKYPVDGAEVVSTLILTDAVTLIGTYGDYYYVEDLDYTRGFVLKDDLSATLGSTWDGLEITIATPSVNSEAYVDGAYYEYIANDHAFAITWSCNQILTEEMTYRVDLYEVSNDVRKIHQTFVTSGNTVSIASTIMNPNTYYEIEVSVVATADREHRFGVSATFEDFYVCADYEEYLGMLIPGYDLLQIMDKQIDLTNQICGFFNGESVSFANGTTYNVAELKGYVNNGAVKAYVGATGDAVTTMALKSTRALFIADKIARQYSNRSSRVIQWDWMNNILEAIGISKDFANTLMETDYVKDMIVRTYDDGTVFIFYDADKFDEMIRKMGKDPKNIVEGLQQGLSVGLAVANIIDDAMAYWNADYSVLYDIAFALRCSEDEVLKETAEFLMGMNTFEGCIGPAIASNGMRLAESWLREKGDQLMKTVLDMVNPGLYLGIRIGLTANDVLFGINGTYAAACEASWCIDAAVAFRETYNAMYERFRENDGLYYDMCRFTQAYTDLIASGAKGWGNFYETHNNTLANQFLSLIGGDKGYDRAIASCNSLANIVRTDIKTCLLSYYDVCNGEGMIKPNWFDN